MAARARSRPGPRRRRRLGADRTDARRARGRLTGAGSPLELLHPDGVARGPADLVVVDETTSDAAELLLEELAPDGLAYLRLPRRARGALARAAGLRLGPAVLEVGGLLVPAERDAVRWALGSRSASTRGRLAGIAPAAALGLVAPAAIARRPGARPLAGWLRARGPGTAVVAARRAAFLVGGNRLELVAKVGGGLPARRELTEGRALAALGPAARAAGADVPRVVEESELDGRPLLVMTPVEGTPASTVIAKRPGRLDALLGPVADWLLRWNAATAVETAFSRELVERELLAPARALRVPDSYLSELERRGRAVEGRPVALVAAHNDLTTANVLVARGRPLGIIDWDTAERQTLPLGDLFYAVADAEAARRGFADRLGAFLSCFERRRGALERRLAGALGLDAETADLCFHACWLRHAADETLRAEEETGPFQAIVAAIGERRIRMGG